MESEPVRLASKELFSQVKGTCVKVSLLAQQDAVEPEPLAYELRQLHATLDAHRRQCLLQDYEISPKLADYIFFPISCALKHLELPKLPVQYILHILGYLNDASRVFLTDEASLDQILPLVIFLSNEKGGYLNADEGRLHEDDNFNMAAALCLLAMLKGVPTTYFRPGAPSKRFSALGDSTSILLSLLGPLGLRHEDMVSGILSTLRWLYCTRVSADHTSLVFPGIVSKVINFHAVTKNLHTDPLVQIVDLLGAFAVKVFDQRDLDVLFLHKNMSLETLKDLSIWELGAAESNQLVELKVNKSHPNRTSLWLKSTALQFRLLVLIFMRNLMLNSNGANKIRTNPKLAKAIFDFTRDIYTHCFLSLFNDLVLVDLDILSVLCYVQCKDAREEALFLDKAASIYIMAPRTHLRLLHEHLLSKTETLASVQLPKTLLSLNEEKIAMCLSALRLHLHILKCVLDALMCPKSIDDVVSEAVRNIASFLQQNIEFKKQKRSLKIPKFGSAAEQNSLDGIELPPHIDAKKLSLVSSRGTVTGLRTESLSHLDVNFEEPSERPRLFSTFLTLDSEASVQATLAFIGERFVSDLEETASLLLVNGQSHQHAVALWVVNQLVEAARPDAFDVNEFLNFGEQSAPDPDEVSYLLLDHAQEVLSDAQSIAQTHKKEQYEKLETSYAIALQTISLMASRLDKEEFQTDVLMEHLFPLLEALTFSPSSIVHQQARHLLQQIVDLQYNSSLRDLVRENSDYLIDSMSSQLSVSSGLTPSLSGILLVVLKISGVDLLMLNQLNDVLSQMFTIIDSYHGYSGLVENFFYVFEEIVAKTSALYQKEISDSHKLGVTKPYKPWGLVSRTEMADMINESNMLADPFEYNAEKEYFKNPEVPFSEAEFEDSDDEVDGEKSDEGREDQWLCAVPQNVYLLIQQIFTYGMQLLSHPSIKLRVQVLKTLKRAYGLMSTNYTSLMPLLAQYWSLLLVLSAGCKTLSDYDDSTDMSLAAPALELMICVFDEDARHERFMATRFTEMWTFMKRVWEGKTVLRLPVLKRLYCRLLMLGINTYSRQIPDLTCHEMVRYCFSLGNAEEFAKEKTVQNHLYVLRQASKKRIA